MPISGTQALRNHYAVTMRTPAESNEPYRPPLSVDFWEFPDSPEGREVSSMVSDLAGPEGVRPGDLILPFVTICAASTLAYSGVGIRGEVVSGAVAVELLHTADAATCRDLLVARALRCASELGSEAGALIAGVLEERCLGEATSALFAGAARMGALLQGAPERKQRAFEEFGRRLGTALQIADGGATEEAATTAADWSLSAISVLTELDGLNPEPLALLERLANDVVDRLDSAPEGSGASLS